MLASSSWKTRNINPDNSSLPSLNSDRSQMSGVSHVVLGNEPGVPAVPKPPGPSFQAEASKAGLDQSSGGRSNVYLHLLRPSVASASIIFMGGPGNSPRLAASRTAGSILLTARSYVSRPLHSVSTSVV